MTKPKVKPKAELVKREYRSTVRDDQARETRRRIRQAADDLFLRDGYVATSMAAVAAAAGVSRPTVFNAFGSKAELLREVADVRLAGDDEPLDVLSRPVGRAMLDAEDPEEVLALHAQLGAELLERVVPIMAVVAEAAPTDADAAALLRVHEEGRLFGMRATVDRLDQLGALRKGLSADEAAESLWLLSGAEPFALARRRGWTTEQYRDWYLRAARAVLLEPGPAKPRRR